MSKSNNTLTPCVHCGITLENIGPDVNQPYKGTSFFSHGNYGSTVFDPLNPSVTLQVNICDPCMRELSFRGRIARVTTHRPRINYDYALWDAPQPKPD